MNTTRDSIEGEITALKMLLADTDYKCLKYAEGAISEAEYAADKAKRAMWRERINVLEEQFEKMTEEAGEEGHRIIPDAIPAEDPFKLDELGWWTDGLLYKSLLSTNVWTPAQLPTAWEVVTQ